MQRLVLIFALAACRPAPKPPPVYRYPEAYLGRHVSEIKVDGWSTKGDFHAVDGPGELTLTLPSGRTWLARPLHSVNYNANPALELTSIDVTFERPDATDWPDAVARAMEIAESLGVDERSRDPWKEKLLAKKLVGVSDRIFPSFPLEECVTLTVTLMVRNPNRWIVSAGVALHCR